jgi:hypothetical protein
MVLCLALLLTLVCASALAAVPSKYTSNGKQINMITTYGDFTVVDSVLLEEPKCKTGKARLIFMGGNSEIIDVDPLHDVEVKVKGSNVPLCEANGVGQYVCKDCGAVDPYKEGDIPISPTGHHFTKLVIDQKETCTKDGKLHYECSTCGKKQTTEEKGVPPFDQTVYYEIITAHGFVPGVYKVVKEQTCKEGGQRYRLCAKCGEPELDSYPGGSIVYDAVYALPADHTYGDWIVDTTIPACMPGVKVRYCSVCNYKDTVVIPPSREHEFKVTLVFTGTCTQTGGLADAVTPADVDATRSKKVCKTCGQEVPFDPYSDIPANCYDQHTFVSDPNGVNIPAECVGGLDGTQTLICTKCGGHRVHNIPHATEHKWGEWVLKVKPGTDGTPNGVWERSCTNYHCIAKDTYVGKTAPKGATPIATPTTKPTTTDAPVYTGVEKYSLASWSFNGSGVSGQVAGNVSYRTPGLKVNVIVYTPTGTFLSVSSPVDEDGKFDVSAGGAVYAVSLQLKDNNKTYQNDGRYI